jgi:soluble lytic murein transglycosylase
MLVSWCALACSAASPTAPPSPHVVASPAPSGGSPAPTSDGRPGAGTLERARTFRAAYQAMQDGRRDEARRGFAESATALPELADHALYHQGRLALEAGDVETARGAFERLLAEHPDSVWLAAAAVDRGRIALDEGSPSVAAGWFERALEAPDTETAAAARLGLAEARLSTGQPAAAYALLDELRGKGGAAGERARTLAEALEARGAAALGLDPDELRLRTARARLREGRPEPAREAVAPLLGPGHPLRGEAALVVARSWGKANPAEASAAYAIAIESSAATDVAGTALFERGRAAWNRDEDAAADADFAALVDRFPAHASVPEALYARARIAEARGDAAAAIAFYEQVATRFPGTRLGDDCGWRAAYVRYDRGAYGAAADAFAALGPRDEARYWRARALEATGDEEGARVAFAALRESSPGSYLAWWIDRRIGPAAGRPGDPPAEDGSARPAPPLGGAAAYHHSRGQILVAIGLRGDAVREYAAVEAVSGPDPFLVGAYREAEAWPNLVRLGIRLQQGGRAGYETATFPRPYVRDFEQGAARAGVDPLLLVAMARQESLFDPAAVSPAGARGVLQLMPATATLVAGRSVDTAALHDPSYNIGLGAQYFDGLLQRFGGRIVPAVAAYNAGPDAVDRWLARSAGVEGDQFVERITYRETRDYVKAVLRNYRTYHLLYGNGRLPRPLLY